MNKGQRNIFIGIIITLIFIIAIIWCLLINIKTTNKVSENNQVNISFNSLDSNIISGSISDSEESEYVETEYKTIQCVDNYSEYFTVKAFVSNFLSVYNSSNSEKVMNLLSKKYISKYEVNSSNVINKLGLAVNSSNLKFVIIDMKKAIIDDSNDIYIVSIIGSDEKVNTKLIIQVDVSKRIYCVLPYKYMSDKGYNNLSKGNKINFEAETLMENENNKFAYSTNTSDLDMCKEYFVNYSFILKNYKTIAYNKLNSEYILKRFATEEKFKTYLEDNVTAITLMNLKEYKVNIYENYTDYICADKYGNYYIFRKKSGITDYEVFVDNYTILSTKEREYYNELEEFDKAKYNLSKFIYMLNSKDYNAIYNILDSTFKQNNFNSIEELKQYLNNKLYNQNSIEIENIDEKENQYYIFTCVITNLLNTNESKKMTVIVSATSTENFTISFSV